jgi:phage baseplate assembly protein V
MAIARDALQQLDRLLRPLKQRIANTIARAVVQVINDGTKLQSVQLGAMAGETIDDGERFQEYGFTSVPLDGAEAVVVFPNGDRGHPLVIAIDDRRHRPTGLEAGEVAVYSETGAQVILKANGDIEISCAPGGKVYLNDGSGGEQLITKSQYDAHTHGTGVGPSGPPDNAATSGTTVTMGK